MKKKIPIKLLQALQPNIDKNLDLVEPIFDDKFIVYLVDKDENSDFFFKVSENKSQVGAEKFIVDYKPDSTRSAKNITILLEIENVVDRLKGWLQLIANYSNIKTIYDDPILKKYQEDFYKKLEILDEDADVVGFNFEQQIFLDQYINQVKGFLNEVRDTKTESEQVLINDLIKDTDIIKDKITKESKRKLIIRLSNFFGKAQNAGLEIIKEIFINIGTELATKLILGPH